MGWLYKNPIFCLMYYGLPLVASGWFFSLHMLIITAFRWRSRDTCVHRIPVWEPGDQAGCIPVLIGAWHPAMADGGAGFAVGSVGAAVRPSSRWTMSLWRLRMSINIDIAPHNFIIAWQCEEIVACGDGFKCIDILLVFLFNLYFYLAIGCWFI